MHSINRATSWTSLKFGGIGKAGTAVLSPARSPPDLQRSAAEEKSNVRYKREEGGLEKHGHGKLLKSRQLGN